MILLGNNEMQKVIFNNEEYYQAYKGTEKIWEKPHPSGCYECVYSGHTNVKLLNRIYNIYEMYIDGKKYYPTTTFDFETDGEHTVYFHPVNHHLVSSNVFQDCQKLVRVSIPEVTTIEDNAFSGCEYLKTIDIPNVTSLGTSCFNSCDLSYWWGHVSSNLTTIGNMSFAYSAVGDIDNIIANATTILDGAFQGCTEVGFVNIPTGVTTIGNNAFAMFDDYCDFRFLSTTPPSVSSPLMTFYGNYQIKVPQSALTTYQNAWPAVAHRLVGY